MNKQDRITPFVEMAKCNKVLDLGCTFAEKDGTWLHGEMVKVALHVKGIDIDEKLINEYKAKGYDIKYQDAEKPFDLDEQFDLIVASEILDHTDNLGIFMDNVKRHLRPDGRFAMLIHNPQALEFFVEQAFWGIALPHVFEHTHWQNEATIRVLFKRHGLKLDKKTFLHYGAQSKQGKIFDTLTWFMPARFSRGIIFEAVHG